MRLATGLAAAFVLVGTIALEAQGEPDAVEPSPAAGEMTATAASDDTVEVEAAAETPAEEPDEEHAEKLDNNEADQPAPVERITFSLPFSSETGGGIASGTAGTLEYVEENLVTASGGVEFIYQNIKLQAETISIDLETKTLIAEGRVILDEGPSRITGERVVFDLEKKQGTFYEAKAFVSSDVYFEGAEISKVAEDIYTVTDGTMSSCTEDRVPDWSFRLGKARIKVDGFARVKNVRMRVKKVPVLYLPYALFPTQGGRVPGLLFPNFGYSSSRGTVLGLAYFQPFGDSYDATIFADAYGSDYFGLGTEFRYRPSVTTGGIIRAQAIDDPIEDTVRWKASWQHSSNQLPFGLRGVVNYTDFSDFEFFRDFERSFNDVSIRSLYSNGFISGNWGSHSLNILADDRETFIRSGVTVTQTQLPEIEYRLRPTRLGKLPLYLSVLTSANRFEIGRTGVIQGSYSRADFLPSLTLPISTVPWLSFSVAASARTTWYEDSVTANKRAFRGESLTRFAPSVSASIIGPSFSKVIEKRVGSFGKFKHIIEPRWSYSRIDEFDDQEFVPLFDEVDTLINQEIFSVSLINRILAKPADEDSLAGAREILSLEIGQSFSLDDRPFEQSSDKSLLGTKSPISARLRFAPSDRASLEARTTYSALFDRVSSASLLAGYRFGADSVGLTWVTSINPELGTTRSHQARVFTDLTLIRNHLRMQNQVNVDFVTGLIQQHRHIFYYTSQCWGMRFEFREFKTTTRRDRDIRVALSLKNIGTFLDLNHGEQDRFP